jgi:hypothetical protein
MLRDVLFRDDPDAVLATTVLETIERSLRPAQDQDES